MDTANEILRALGRTPGRLESHSLPESQPAG